MAGQHVDPSLARLTIVVGTHNRLDQIRRCIESVRRVTTTPLVIHVTDAGSNDGTIEFLRSIAAPDLTSTFAGKRIGQAKAYNEVFKTVSTPFVAWLSDDNEVVNSGLDVAVRALEGDSRIGMVGLKVRDLQGPFTKAPYIGGISSAGVLNVNQGVLRTNVLRDVGYFSEIFGFYGIDPDLTAKVLYAGHHIVYTKKVAIHHYRNWPTDPTGPEATALKEQQERSKQLYQAKYGAVGRDDRVFQMRRDFWKWFKRKMGARLSLDSDKLMLGALPRDWANSITARHINPLDPVLAIGSEVYLRQYASPQARPRGLPDDLQAAELASLRT